MKNFRRQITMMMSSWCAHSVCGWTTESGHDGIRTTYIFIHFFFSIVSVCGDSHTAQTPYLIFCLLLLSTDAMSPTVQSKSSHELSCDAHSSVFRQCAIPNLFRKIIVPNEFFKSQFARSSSEIHPFRVMLLLCAPAISQKNTQWRSCRNKTCDESLDQSRK